MAKRIVFLDLHLRNLSLYHVCNAWSIKFRGYPVASYEYFSHNGLIGFKDVDYSHKLKPKPCFCESFVIHESSSKSNYIQLSLF